MSGDLVLGIDGGGSKTAAALADRTGRIVARSRAGGVNPLDNRAWQVELGIALTPLANRPGIIAAAAALPSHGEVEAVSAAQREAVASILVGRRQTVINDVDAAQLGAFGGGPGILALSGTGSMAWARDADGRSHRVGGWGDVVGDEGSSYWIGLRILNLVSQSLDGRAPPTALVTALFAELGIDRTDPANSLEGWASQLVHPRSGIAALAPLATRLAGEGDAGAQAIVDTAAHEIARHVHTLDGRIGTTLPWSYAGGTFSSPLFVAAVARHVGREPILPRLPPLGGALLAASRLAGWPIDNAWIEHLGGSLRETAPGSSELQLT